MTAIGISRRDAGVNGLLFAGTALLWGSSAIVTGHQALSGAPEVSVGYRMAIVSLVMFAWCLISGERILVRGRERAWILLQGVLFFGLAFIAFYYATRILPTGVAALVLSTSSLFSALIGWLFLRARVGAHLIAGLACGIGGLAIVVLPQLAGLSGGTDVAIGFAWATAAAAGSGCGTVIAARNPKTGLPVATIMSWSAMAGAVFAFGWAFAAGASFAVDVSAEYVAGLLYLALAASCITFLMYFNLVRRIGPAGASYTLSIVPIVALLISVAFEGLAIDLPLMLGTAAIVVGNVLVLTGTSRPAPTNP
jgi:drug/metabolite transporter (DMT)-like permease